MATLSLDLVLTTMLTPRGQYRISLYFGLARAPFHRFRVQFYFLPCIPVEKNSWKDLRLNPDTLALQATVLATRPLTFLDYCLFH